MSVIGQTFLPAECLIVDDASTDDTVSKCQTLIDGYSGPVRFEILHHDRHRGVSASRNTGTYAAKGDYIYYLDSDDEMTADCLEKLVKPVLDDNSFEMVVGDFLIDRHEISGAGSRHSVFKANSLNGTPSELHTNAEIRAWFYRKGENRSVNLWNRLLKLQFVRENKLYCKEGLLYEDQLWAFYLMRCLNNAAFVDEVTYIYYRRPSSIMTGTRYNDKLNYFGAIFQEVADNVVPGRYIDEVRHFARILCGFYPDASDDSRYRHAYDVFYRELSDCRHCGERTALALTRLLSTSRAGRRICRANLKLYEKLLMLKRIVLKRLKKKRS